MFNTTTTTAADRSAARARAATPYTTAEIAHLKASLLAKLLKHQQQRQGLNQRLDRLTRLRKLLPNK